MQIFKHLASVVCRKTLKGNHATPEGQTNPPPSASDLSEFVSGSKTDQCFKKGMFNYDVLHSHSSSSTMMISGHSSEHWLLLYLPVPKALHWAQSRYWLHLLGQFWEIQAEKNITTTKKHKRRNTQSNHIQSSQNTSFIIFVTPATLKISKVTQTSNTCVKLNRG